MKCFNVQLKETPAQKKSTVESSYPNLPGSSGLSETGTPKPSKIGAVDNLKSFLADEPVTTFEIGQSSKQTPVQRGTMSICWTIFKPCPILTEPAFKAI